MRITTKIQWDMNTGRVLAHEYFDYEGPLALCGGGPSGEQRAAAASQARLTDKEIQIGDQRNAREESQYQAIRPFAMSRLENGLPFFDALMDANGGTVARSFAPAYAALNQRYASSEGMPGGAREAATRALDIQKARTFDDSIVQNLAANENAKAEAARLLTQQQQIANPAQFYGLANSGNNSIMQAPLQGPGIGGILGGIAGAGLGGLMGNPKGPF